MTRDEMAAKLNGREYGEEVSQEDCQEAKRSGLLIVFGYSDDNTEFRGIFKDEIGSYEDTALLVHRDGVMASHDDCECKYCGYEKQAKKCAIIKALWCKEPGYSWTFETDLPHSTFEIMEGDEHYCRGIVIDGKDLPML